MSVYAFLKKLYRSIGPGMLPENGRIFENSFAGAIFLVLGGPAGGSALERASPPRQQAKHMTRRAFLSSRVIQAQEQLTSRRRVKNFRR